MMKKMKIVLLFTLLFTFISCVNDIPQVFESEAASVPSADGKTYLNIDVDSIYVSGTYILIMYSQVCS